MKKKLIVMIAALMVLAATGAFAFGIGLQFNGNVDDLSNKGPALTFKVDSVPLIWAVNWYIGDDTSIGLTGDYWILNNKITNIGKAPLNWFIGVGFFTNALFGDDFEFSGGIRVPVGLNMFLANGFFEPFVQLAPSFGLQFVPSLGTSSPFFPISAGFRMVLVSGNFFSRFCWMISFSSSF